MSKLPPLPVKKNRPPIHPPNAHVCAVIDCPLPVVAHGPRFGNPDQLVGVCQHHLENHPFISHPAFREHPSFRPLKP
jgi:hypothetical protein